MRAFEPRKVPVGGCKRWARDAWLLSGRCALPTAAAAAAYCAAVLASYSTPFEDFLLHAQLLVLGVQMITVASKESGENLLTSIRRAGAGWLSVCTILIGAYVLSLVLRFAGVGDSHPTTGPALHDVWVRAAVIVTEESVGWLLIPVLCFLLPLLLLADAEIDRAWMLSWRAVKLNLRPLGLVAAVSFVTEQAVLIVAVCTWPPILLVIALAIQPLVAGFMFAAYRDVFLNLPPVTHTGMAHYHHALATEGAP